MAAGARRLRAATAALLGLLLAAALASRGAAAEGVETAFYNLYDPDPACLAMQPPLCTSSDVFSDDVDRLLITRINLLRFDPLLFLQRMKLDFSDVACGLSRKEVVPLTPVRWRSDLSQAAKFHARAMAESQGSCYQRDTCPAQCALFGGTCDFRARISVFHECGDDDIVFQVIGQGDLDNVLRAWVRDYESCTYLMSRGAQTIGVARHTDDHGQAYWTVIMSEARTRFHLNQAVSGSHEPVPGANDRMYRFGAMYFDVNPDVGLRDFSVVIGNEHHFLTRHRGYSYNTDLVGKSGLFEDDVLLPEPPEGVPCVAYHFNFQTVHSSAIYRLPQTGEYYVTGYRGCNEVYTEEEFVAEVVDVVDDEELRTRGPPHTHPPSPESIAASRMRMVKYISLGCVAYLLWRYRRRLLRPVAALPLFQPPRPKMRP